MILSKATSYRKLLVSSLFTLDSISVLILGLPFKPSFLNKTDFKPNSLAGQGVMSVKETKYPFDSVYNIASEASNVYFN